MEEKFNIILDDENIIGKVENIIKYLYEQIKYDIDNVEDLEEKTINIAEIFDFIQVLLNDIEDNEIELHQVIKVIRNPMGCFQYGEV